MLSYLDPGAQYPRAAGQYTHRPTIAQRTAAAFQVGECYLLRLGHRTRFVKCVGACYSFPDGSAQVVFETLPTTDDPFTPPYRFGLNVDAAKRLEVQ